MIEFQVAITAALVLGFVTNAVLAFAFLAQWRRFRSCNLLRWYQAHVCLACYSVAKFLSLCEPLQGSAWWIRPALTLATTASCVLHPILLLLGSIALVRSEPRTKCPRWLLAGLPAGLVAFVAMFVGADPDTRVLARVVATAVVSAACLAVVKFVLYRHSREQVGSGHRVVVFGFAGWVVVQIAYAVSLSPGVDLPNWASNLWLVGFADTWFHAVIGLGLLMWHLERTFAAEQRAWQEVEKNRAAWVHVQRLEVVGRLAAGLAHDYNNVLTFILGNAQMARVNSARPAAVERSLAAIEAAVDRSSHITRSLLAIGRAQPLTVGVVRVGEVVGGAEALLHSLLQPWVALTVAIDPATPLVAGDPAMVEQILLNLVLNARDAMPVGGSLRITTQRQVADEVTAKRLGIRPGPCAVWTVADDGPGLAPEVKEHLFEPFVTTKPQGKGSGLGLASVYGAVRQMGGAIEATSESGQGTSFVIWLPEFDAVHEVRRKTNAESVGG